MKRHMIEWWPKSSGFSKNGFPAPRSSRRDLGIRGSCERSGTAGPTSRGKRQGGSDVSSAAAAAPPPPITVVPVPLGERAYEILVGRNLLAGAGERIAALGAKAAAIVTDAHVGPLYAPALSASLSGQ